MQKQKIQKTTAAKTKPVAGVTGRRPVRVGEVLLHDAEQVEDADDEDEARVLEEAMKLLTMPGITIFSACGRMISRIDCQ